MLTFTTARPMLVAVLAAAGLLAVPRAAITGQGGRGGPLAAASRLDIDGRTPEARVIFQRAIDSAATPLAKSAAQRAMAMSFAFDGDCANTVKYEEMVIAYWSTRELAEPQNAFYQEGEMANEAARVCIDAGALDIAERYYRRGSELGLKEPDPQTHPASLWDFRLAHALARLAARRGNGADARRYVAIARGILDGDTAMAAAQERYYPYLTGYVALYTNDLKGAEADLTKATQANPNDPFMHYLLAMMYERAGNAAKANELYQQAYDLSTAHNPPSAFTRPNARKKIAGRQS